MQCGRHLVQGSDSISRADLSKLSNACKGYRQNKLTNGGIISPVVSFDELQNVFGDFWQMFVVQRPVLRFGINDLLRPFTNQWQFKQGLRRQGS
jgi:hypothetical protein